jgi:hypothetical protein
MDPLYFAEGADVWVLCTSARIAAAVAGSSGHRPTLESILGLSGAGFMISDATPYPGVHAVPADASVRITWRGVRIRHLPSSDVDPAAPIDHQADAMADSIVEAASHVGRQRGDIRCHITGGKDSRLALAAFRAAGVDVVATTTGFPEHPDSMIGSKIARIAGVEHEQRTPVVQESHVQIDPVSRTFHALRAAEGMLTAWEILSARGDRYSARTLVCGGHGGELLRAGYAHGLALTPDSGIGKLMKIVARHRTVLTADAIGHLDALVRLWHDRVRENPGRGLEWVYRCYRSGRWHAVARSAYQIRGPRYTVLADNQVVKIAAGAAVDAAADERLAYLVLRRLHPALAHEPFYANRWGFEARAPRSGFSAPGWESRAPIGAPSGRASFDVRKDYTQEVHEQLAEVILDSELIGTVLDRQATQDLLSRTRVTRSRSDAVLIWSLYTAAHLRAGTGERTQPPSSAQYVVPVPE